VTVKDLVKVACMCMATSGQEGGSEAHRIPRGVHPRPGRPEIKHSAPQALGRNYPVNEAGRRGGAREPCLRSPSASWSC